MQLQELKSLLAQLADAKSKLEEAKSPNRDWSAEADEIEENLNSSAEPSEHIGSALQLARDCIEYYHKNNAKHHHEAINQIEKIYDHAEMRGDYEKMHNVASLPLHYVRSILRTQRMMN